jgi:ubiquinol-cytochrome c reductase cytochrome c1 subunit
MRFFFMGFIMLTLTGTGYWMIFGKDDHHATVLPQKDWFFHNPVGVLDLASVQRGFQVYREVCAACHSLNLMSYRNLTGIGFTPAQVKQIAAEYQVSDGPNDDGDYYDRPGRPSDKFVAPYPNKKAAMASNGGAYPPDLSLMAKARKGGPDYIHALLTGYDTPPEGIEVMDGLHYNTYFPGNQLAMAAPLSDGIVTYADGTPTTVPQMATDVTQFLTWTSDIHQVARKRMGIKVLIYLFLLTGLLYAVKRRIWSRLKS